MKNNRIQETTTSVALIGLLLIILNPFNLWMPDMVHMLVLIALVIVFGVFASFVLREKAEDERDILNRSFAGRSAFISGSAVILIGILVQAHRGDVDIWLIATLVVMVIAKITARIYNDQTN